MKTETLKLKWQDPLYREHMRQVHLGQRAWNKGIKTGIVPKTAFKKGDKKTTTWFDAMREKMRGENNPSFKHGLVGTPEYSLQQRHKRRARKILNGGYFTASEWIELKKQYGNKCLKCKRGDLKLVADHVIPLARGGENSIKNIQPLCSRCNSKKYIKDDDYRNLLEVSIIIPCYNQAEFLREAIESALVQTYPSEVIVIVDGSPDNSLEIAKEYPIRVINQTNRGLASARNTGIMWATGDFVLPLDSDDILMPNAVERIIQKAKEVPDADVIGLSIHCFGKAEQDVILMPNPVLEDFKIGNRLAYCSAIKRSALLECGGYSAKMDVLGGFEDLHLWYDLLLRGKKIITIPEILMLYRTKESSMWLETEKPEKKKALWNQIIKDFPQIKDHAKS